MSTNSPSSPSESLWFGTLRPHLFSSAFGTDSKSRLSGNPNSPLDVPPAPNSNMTRHSISRASATAERAATKLAAFVTPKSVTSEADFTSIQPLIDDFSKCFVLLAGSLVATAEGAGAAPTRFLKREVLSAGDELARNWGAIETLLATRDCAVLSELAFLAGKACETVTKTSKMSLNDVGAVGRELLNRVRQLKDVQREFSEMDDDLLNPSFAKLAAAMQLCLKSLVKQLAAFGSNGAGSGKDVPAASVLEAAAESAEKICDLVDEAAVCLSFEGDDFLSDLENSEEVNEIDEGETRSLNLYEGLQKLEAIRKETTCGMLGELTKGLDTEAKGLFRDVDIAITDLVGIVDLMASKAE